MTRRNDEGAALILAVMLIMVLSAISISLVFLSQTETYASMNYRLMSQARYGAESGVHKAVNYLLNTYAQPGSVSDPLSNYNIAVSPVTYGGAPVVLSAVSGVASNYPVAATTSAFNTAAQGTLSVGGYNVQYAAYATLLSIQPITAYGTGVASVVQTWRITADGTVTGPRQAQVEVSAVLERQIVPAHSYAMFATSPTCAALTFGGSATTDSYDSSHMTLVSGVPAVTQSGGNVGTNGNLSASGNIRVYGTLSTPKTGVGGCASGAVDAFTVSGGSPQITQGILQLPQAVAYPTPAAPNPLPPTTTATLAHASTCADLGTFTAPATCATVSATELDLDPHGSQISLGNVNLTRDITIHVKAGTYNLNSLSTAGSAAIIVDSGPAIVNIAGVGQATPINFQNGAAISVGTFNPSLLEFQYGGSGGVILTGGSQTAAIVYAPNAAVQVTRGGDFYGSIVGATSINTGGTFVHYDTHLAYDFYTTGNYMLSSFTWKKY